MKSLQKSTKTRMIEFSKNGKKLNFENSFILEGYVYPQ